MYLNANTESFWEFILKGHPEAMNDLCERYFGAGIEKSLVFDVKEDNNYVDDNDIVFPQYLKKIILKNGDILKQCIESVIMDKDMVSSVVIVWKHIKKENVE